MENGELNNANFDSILENMFLTLPVFHKKLLRMDPGTVTANFTRLHFTVMGILSEGSMTVTELAKMMIVPKPQMTHLLDHLVGLGIVDRLPDEKDRRVINLVLTDHGRLLLVDMKRKMDENIKKKLSVLSPEELAEMLAAMKILQKIGAKL